MRLWSLHPRYLDSKGLTACWREGLLARKVLAGGTWGYRRHPQLTRFREMGKPMAYINEYLWGVYEEARGRGFGFDEGKLEVKRDLGALMRVTSGQLEYEREHLLGKLRERDRKKAGWLKQVKVVQTHPVFEVVEGGVEEWERRIV